jgi:PIN domain nuclease of toxin-antitoxin system
VLCSATRPTGHLNPDSPSSHQEQPAEQDYVLLPLPGPVDRLIPGQRVSHRIEPLGLDDIAVLQLPRLPDLHRDPFDRMLVCQAIVNGLILLTPDEFIAQCPVRTTW